MFKINTSLLQTTKIISRTRFITVPCIYSTGNRNRQCLSKSNATKQETAHRTWGMERDGAHQLCCFTASSTSLASLLMKQVACFLHQSHWDLTRNYAVHRPALRTLLSCSMSIHSSERAFLKFYPIDSLHDIIQKAIKTRVFPTPVRQSSRFWSRVHYTDQHEFFSEQRL